MKESINMKGYVNVYQHEDNKNYKNGEKIIDEKQNKFTDNMFRWFSYYLGRTYIKESDGNGLSGSGYKMTLGTDTSTSTTVSTNSLVSPIGSGDGTKQDAKSIDGVTESSTDVWEIKFICTWYSGSISGTVGELGLWLRILDNNISFGHDVDSGEDSIYLCNRLSVADGEFSSFSIDTSKSLTVEWIVRYIYG